MTEKSKIWISIFILLGAFLSDTLWAVVSKNSWNDEVTRSQGVIVFYATYQEITGQDKKALIRDLKLHEDSIVRIAARHYYGDRNARIQRDQIEIQFMEPQDTRWRIPPPRPVVLECIDKNQENILAQLYHRMH